ncbi:hypothetical protein FZX02_03070, partial [Synechococcus sp. MU1644]|nr:hypothetical protein [Synechococcus sp. MU1644]
MLQKTLMTGVSLGLLAACASAQETKAPGWLDKDFVDLTNMFEGRWDNDRHVFFADAAGLEAATLAPRQYIEISRVALAGDNEIAAGTVTFKATRT